MKPADASLSPLVVPTERERVEQAFAGPPVPAPATLHAAFDAQADRQPEAPAVLHGAETLTYGELRRRANQLAQVLRTRGVSAGARVGVLLERSSGSVVAILGILKAGGAYVPLAPDQPRARLERLLEDSDVAAVVTREALLGLVPARLPAVCLDADARELASAPEQAPACEVGPGAPAYVLYTSGSTGQAKGVVVPHRGLLRLALGGGLLAVTPGDRVLHVTALTFDVASGELWLALANGACLAVLHEEVLLSPGELAAFIRAAGITVSLLTTAVLHHVAREAPGAFAPLSLLTFGGEACDPRAVRAVLAAGGPRRLLHAYGPTESSVISIVHPVREVAEDAVTVPLGQPVPGTETWVLDSRLEPVAPGEVGELYLGGDGLALGYLGRPELTAERFVPDPFARVPGRRLYRTGDRVRVGHSGAWEFVGRADQQVKLRGHRIELGEVEAALLEHPSVAQAAAVVCEDASGAASLVACFVPRVRGAAGPQELRRFLEARLPAYEVPAAFVELEALPLTPGGKVDRGALAVRGARRPALETAYAAPRTSLERTLVALWSECLGVAPIGIHDDFLALGGDSLRAARIASRARQVLERDVSPALVLRSGTVAALAGRLGPRALADEGGTHSQPLRSEMASGPAPLSFAQQRLWFLQELSPDSAAYTVPTALRLTGRVSPTALARALTALVERHAMLRTTFGLQDGAAVQRVGPAVAVPLPVQYLSGLPEPEREQALHALALREAAVPFDLEQGPLLRAVLVVMGPDAHVLLLVMHHIVCDGWSLGLLARELVVLHGAFMEGLAPESPALAWDYGDYARWQRSRAAEDASSAALEHWRRELAGVSGNFGVPADHPRPEAPSQRGAQRRFTVPPETAAALARLGRATGVTPFTVYLSAFFVLLHRHTGEAEALVGVPGAGRTLPGLESVVGFFVNMLPIRQRLAGALSFRELLLQVRERVLTALSHQHVPFERLVEVVRPPRVPGQHPLVQVVFALQPQADVASAGGLALRLDELDSGAAPFDLFLQLWERRDGVEGALVFSTELFEPSTAARLVDDYLGVLAAAAADPSARLEALVLLDEVERQVAARAREAEARLLEHPAVSDCAVRLRRTRRRHLERVAHVATRDPAALARLGPGLGLPSHLAPEGVMPLAALPLDEEGRVDELALSRLAVLDEALARGWEERLRAVPGVTGALARLGPPAEPLPLLHASDLLLPRPPLARRTAPPVAPREATPGEARPLAFADGGPLEIPEGAPRTLTEALLRTAREHERRGIVYVEDSDTEDFQSYATLLEEARAVLGGLQRSGLGPGARVLLQVDSRRELLTAFWACILGGLIPVTVSVAAAYGAHEGLADKLYGAWRHLGRPVLLSTRALAPAPRGLGAAHPELEAATVLCLEDMREGPPAEHLHPSVPTDVAFLQLSSGSTGVPKCIQETHQGVVHHVHGVLRANGYASTDVSLNWLPVDHVGALIMFHLKDLYLGIRAVQVRTERVVAEPLLWLDLLERHRVTHTWSPNFGFRRVADALVRNPGRRWDLSALRRLLNGGEQVTLSVVRDFLERLAPSGLAPGVMQPAYGMAEVCTGVAYNNDFTLESGFRWLAKSSLQGTLESAPPGDAGAVPFVDLGPPIPGVQLRIVDVDGQVLPERVIGRLQIRGAVVTPGYLDHDEANREAFVGEGWFNTGDLGFLDGGRLSITGREKEVIIIRGANHACHEIEDVVSAVPGVEPTFAAACATLDAAAGTEGLAVFFVPREDSPAARAVTTTAIRSALTARLGLAPAVVVPVERSGFPRTTSGKVQRAQLRQWLEEGRFTPALKELDLLAGKAHTVPDWFFRRTWVRREPDARGASRTGRTVVLLDASGLGEQLVRELRRAGRAAIAVEAGESFARLGPDRYRVAPRERTSYLQLLAALSAEAEPLEAVVHLLAYDDAPAGLVSLDALEQGLGPGAYSLLFLVQALCKQGGSNPVRLLVASSRTQAVSVGEPLVPHKAPLLGLVHSLPREAPWVDCRHVDLPPGEPVSGATLLLRELASGAREREVAYRDGRRYAARLAAVDLPSMARRPLPLVQGGRYLVSGGLGGIGFITARYLLERHGAHLLLLGRGPLEEPGGGETARGRAYRELVALAGREERVVYARADVSDSSAVRAAVARSEARWGAPLDGVFHVAGVFEPGLLEHLEPPLGATFRAKVEGSLVLASLAAERPGAVFMGFSSVNASLGGFEAGAYSAANRYLEHLVLALGAQGLDARCVAWSLWDEVGLGRGLATKDAARALGYLAVSRERGLLSLAAALERAEPVLLVGLDARNPHIASWLVEGATRRPQALRAFYTGTPSAALPRVEDRFGVEYPAVAEAVAELPRAGQGRDATQRQAPPAVEARTGTERELAALWRELLGRDDIGSQENFFDLGGHSMLVVELRARLQKRYGRDIPLVELFRHPTLAALAAFLDARPEAEPRRVREEPAPADPGALAIVGMACRFPGARDPEAFWANLRDGVESIRVFQPEALAAAGVPAARLADPRFVPAWGALDDVESFDPRFFGMSPGEAELTDPQHRLFLECAWEALEHAGCAPEASSRRVGVFAGAGAGGYQTHHLQGEGAALEALGALPALIGNDRDFLATRVAYKLGLRGPALTVQTACSTSLVAVHLACQSLRAGECDVALAGGVSIAFPLNAGYLYQEGGILSPDGHCRAFDRDARGTVGGDGVGVVVLKRLGDALAAGDAIHAVIRGSAINNDGAAKVGFTAPSVEGQAQVIAAAQAAAGVRASSIDYVEAHGTGTALGDPIELAALTQVFREAGAVQAGCAVGSLKPNVGHLSAAAGVASLIKAALALEHEALPPSLHFTASNPELSLDSSPFHVNTALRPWRRGARPRRAGVSAFGFGGTNAHVVLEEAPAPASEPSPRPCQLLVLSARGPEALRTLAGQLGAHLQRHPQHDLADVAYTLAVGRRPFEYRRTVTCRTREEAIAALEAMAREASAPAPVSGEPRRVAFLFPGQGAHHAGMARELLRTEPAFQRHFQACADAFRPHLGLDLGRVLLGADADVAGLLARTELAQPALFAVEHALARVWMEWGVQPAAMLGHSLGELVAACLAGVFSLEDAAALVAERGRLMQVMPPGAMLAVPLGERELVPLLGPGMDLAAVNGDDSCVAAGPEETLAGLERRLAARGTPGRRLHVSRAFHSAMMAPVVEPFRERVASVARQPPRLPLLSNLTGTWLTAEQAMDAETWARQLRHPVRFGDGLRELTSAGHLLLEVGPGRSLSALASDATWSLPSPRGGGSDAEAMRSALGHLWASGVDVDWSGYHAGERRRKVRLPSHPLERRRCWRGRPPTPPTPPATPREDDEVAVLAAAEARLHEALAIPPLESYPGLIEGLEALCTHALCDYLVKRGVDVRPGATLPREELKRRLGTEPRLERLLEAMVDMLAADGLIAVERGEARFTPAAGALRAPEALRRELEARYPGFEGIFRLLDHCVSQYPEALHGRAEPISVLYPGGSARFISDCARRTVEYRSERVYLSLLVEALQRRAREAGRRLRILEVGGGQGLATFHLLQALAGVDVEYHFTDVGRVFVDDARAEAQRLGLSSRMAFGVLDISREPQPQGYEPGGFDVVLAFNVVHATRDVARTVRHLRALLAPGGTLALVEAVRTRRWETLTWGLAEGWWYFDDGLRRDSPLLALDAWEALLRREGLEHVAAYPRDSTGRERRDHGLVLGRKPLEEARPASGEAPRAPVASPAGRHPRPELREPYVAPRTELERQMALICEELLGVERIGVRDDFFELGADSLITLRITDRIHQRLGRQVPAHAAFRGATVERLARAVEGVPEPEPSAVLVPLQAGGSRPPLFFVHPAAGVVFPFVELARRLGPEQPFHALQAAGLDGEEAPDTRVEDMARRYVEAIRKQAPEGPYYLGGFSFGCLVAFEMAQQLRRAGQEVALLALVDEPAPVAGYRPSPLIMARLLASGAAKAAWPYLHDYFYLRHAASPREGEERGGAARALLADALQWLRLRPDGALLETFLARSTLAHYIPPGSRLLALRQPAILPMFRLFMHHVRETFAYQPRAYAGRITLFRCAQPGARARRDATLGWGLLAAGGVDVHDMPGEHLTLLREPHVQVLAERLRRSLDEARSASGLSPRR